MPFTGDTSAPSPLTVHIEHLPDDTAVLRFSGEIDRETAADVPGAFAEALREDRLRKIVVDLSAVTFLDSSGIRTLLSCQTRAEASNTRVEVNRVHDTVR